MKRGKSQSKQRAQPSFHGYSKGAPTPSLLFSFALASSSDHIRYSSHLPLVMVLPSEENSWFPQSVKLGQQVAGFGPFLCCTKEPTTSDERSYLEAKQ